MFRGTDFKFGVHVSMDSPDITPYKKFRKGDVAGVMCPLKIHLVDICTYERLLVTAVKTAEWRTSVNAAITGLWQRI